MLPTQLLFKALRIKTNGTHFLSKAYGSQLIIRDNSLRQSWPTFSVNSHIVNDLGFVGHTVSVARTQLFNDSMKTSNDNV